MEDAIYYLKSKPKPLSLYIFSENKAFCERVIDNLDAGSVCVNDCAVQTIWPGLPFGGTGASGTL